MKKFIDTLFDEKNKLNFQYMDYTMSFYSGNFRSYYLLFYINSQEELINLWERTGNIFKAMKQNLDIYNVDMDKNTMCIYCLETTEEEYYETGKTGTISELSRKISLVEEDLNFFAKHVFLYTDKMKQFSHQHIGNFDALCKKYLNKSHFEQYKDDIYNSFEYDFIINLFIKFPFLKIEKYYVRDQDEVRYRTVTSFVQEKFDKYEVKVKQVEEKIEKIKLMLDDEDTLLNWLEQRIDEDEKHQKEENL